MAMSIYHFCCILQYVVDISARVRLIVLLIYSPAEWKRHIERGGGLTRKGRA